MFTKSSALARHVDLPLRVRESDSPGVTGPGNGREIQTQASGSKAASELLAPLCVRLVTGSQALCHVLDFLAALLKADTLSWKKTEAGRWPGTGAEARDRPHAGL